MTSTAATIKVRILCLSERRFRVTATSSAVAQAVKESLSLTQLFLSPSVFIFFLFVDYVAVKCNSPVSYLDLALLGLESGHGL